jgi:WD40 repeat protein
LKIWTHEGWKPLEAGALEGSGRIHSEHTGARFATVNREGRAAVWSWTGELIAEWQAVDDPIVRVMGRPHVAELLPGGSLLALVTGPQITIWRIGNGVAERVAVLDGHRERSYAHRDLGAITYTYKTSITRLAASQSGQRLLSVATDGLGVIWDMSLLEAVGELKGHGATVGALRAGPVTSSSVPEVYYFNEIVDAVFSEDQNWIVTVSTDGTARVWPFFDSTQALVEHVKIVAPRCLTKSERQAARLDPDPPDWCIQSQKWPYAEKAQQ